jgi:MFS family permease
VALIAVEARTAHPLVPLGLFRSRPLVGTVLVALVLAATTNPPVFFGTLYLQRTMGRSPSEAGLAFLPIYVGIVAGSFLGPRLVGRVGARAAMTASMGAVVGGLLLLASISIRAVNLCPLIAGFALEGAGLGCTSVAVAGVLAAAVGTERQGLASGLLNVTGQVGTALGLATLVAISAARTAALAGPDGPSRAALVAGFQAAFRASAGLAVLGALTALALVCDTVWAQRPCVYGAYRGTPRGCPATSTEASSREEV